MATTPEGEDVESYILVKHLVVMLTTVGLGVWVSAWLTSLGLTLPGYIGAMLVAAFFLDGFAAAAERLSNFIDKAARATLVGDVFDDAATGQGLLNYFIRGMNSGALTEEEALATGLTLDELRSRSFVKILQGRRGQAAG